MSKKEKEVLQRIKESLSKVTENQKEYILGLANGLALANEQKSAEVEKTAQ